MKADSLMKADSPGIEALFPPLAGSAIPVGSLPKNRPQQMELQCPKFQPSRGAVGSQWLVHLVEQKLAPFTFKEPSQLQSPRGLPRGFCCTCITVCSPSANPAPSLPYRGGSGDASASLLHVNLHFRDYSWGTQMTTGPLLPTRSFPVAL